MPSPHPSKHLPQTPPTTSVRSEQHSCGSRRACVPRAPLSRPSHQGPPGRRRPPAAPLPPRCGRQARLPALRRALAQAGCSRFTALPAQAKRLQTPGARTGRQRRPRSHISQPPASRARVPSPPGLIICAQLSVGDRAAYLQRPDVPPTPKTHPTAHLRILIPSCTHHKSAAAPINPGRPASQPARSAACAPRPPAAGRACTGSTRSLDRVREPCTRSLRSLPQTLWTVAQHATPSQHLPFPGPHRKRRARGGEGSRSALLRCTQSSGASGALSLIATELKCNSQMLPGHDRGSACGGRLVHWAVLGGFKLLCSPALRQGASTPLVPPLAHLPAPARAQAARAARALVQRPHAALRRQPTWQTVRAQASRRRAPRTPRAAGTPRPHPCWPHWCCCLRR